MASLKELLLNPWEVSRTSHPQVEASNRKKTTPPGLKEGLQTKTLRAGLIANCVGQSFLGLGLLGNDLRLGTGIGLLSHGILVGSGSRGGT